MAWNLDADKPIYTQLVEIIQTQIISGRYQPGDRLPSVRELAAEASVNPNTMQKAFVELERNGLIVTQRTSGRTVTEDIELINQTQGYLAEEYIKNFFQVMKDIGYSRQEIITLIEKAAQGEE
ncbi:GntR family transcriptional regulator [Kineothrix sp. MB12-C1]|uniref:GntR family transcriptional regulator n=1 Tax=Kineothrix sp. MB12-C1 TaxID=3070215 RepID=UPI0027D1FF2F|nr:GntR family transcriptional regulator [Kineothrix sp. MB12-C1]WMC94512.1 GntR family transcriptional regulator [Kineothrix sp. MB12-C1]